MIKADNLREFRPTVRYKDGDGITLQTIQDAIYYCAQNMKIPVEFRSDQVKSGGLFNSQVDDCIVLYHPEHPNDYFNFCVRVSKQGTYAFVAINDFGKSKQINNANIAQFMKEDRQGQTISYKVGSLMAEGIGKVLGGAQSKQKFEEENNYYQCIFDIFDEIVV
ncbi:MAG: hypothetical protein ACRCU3_09160 [Eubacteriaceae bacterium]